MNYRKTLLAVSIISSLCVSSAIYAQDSTDTSSTQQQKKARADDVKNLSTVVVTGIRGAVEKALDIKRDANSNLEVVTAEDVGKLPAHNVADTLQRLPGVNISSASADEGGFDEADRVSLRGTSPSLTQTTIDGHAVGSADWFVLSQGSNMGRSVSYTLLPSELVSRVEVHKSSEARLMDGGTTGSVDIITRKPLDFTKQFTTNLTVGGVHSSTAGKTDPQLSGLFNYKNADSTFGVMVQLFKQKRSLQREAQELPAGFTTIAPGSALATSNPDLSGVRVPSLLGSTLFTQVRDRKGGLLDVQFKPADNLTLDFNAFRSDMSANNYNRNFMLWGGNFATTQAPQPGYVVKNNVLTDATYAGVPGTNYIVYDMISRDATSKASYYTLDADWQASENIEGKFQVGTTKGTGETSAQYIAEVTAANGGGASWSTHGISAPVDWTVGGDISPAGVTGFGTWGNQQVKAIDKEKWGTADFTQYFNSGVLTSFNYGVRFAKHDREVQSPEGASPGNIWPALQGAATGNYPSNFAAGIGGSFPTNIWYFTPGALKSAITANSTWLSNNDGPTGRHNYGAEYSVDERNMAAYFQANFQGDNWSGNVGLRYVNIKQDINTYFAVAAPVVPDVSSLFGAWTRVNTKNNYSRALPSANLKFNLASNVLFRFAASQTQTLPDYSALGASSWGSDLSKTGGGGNTHLKPVLSTNFDAGIEWYFMPRGLLAATAYSMNMKNYVAYGIQTQMLFSELTHQLEPYQVSMPVNADAKVSGVELAYNQPIGDNFGVDANYTYADGSSAFTWSDGSNHLLGTSKNTYNVGAYFESDKFGARVSYTARSSFLIGLSGASPYYQDKFGTLSASLSYKATDWLSFSLDAMNLNNPTYKYYETVNIPHAFYENGRQYYLNAHLSF
ncbi:TonB-dependent receptor [Rhodanobacter sp. AS-Z3]|uniref:TonB-dependent receptor n=1 Tax=Rhodanobacter sp. AS-Z3 TaxID=3031330 RepID=UPI002478CEE7|nr:TonB-dependent receptor [Rhodanobacter sp. AS-Z3]WEN15675.1 TonB-dependent receptor [Rhodanobacter sp. AS-Z3]